MVCVSRVFKVFKTVSADIMQLQTKQSPNWLQGGRSVGVSRALSNRNYQERILSKMETSDIILSNDADQIV